ncbi:MAG TPA: NAD(P)-binding protein [Anaeromyxobacteraceae bacterium]|nr:NAD(P)-binding protein [Anaeromyxobacteraceae bacterium]
MAATFKPPATQRLYDACILGGGPGGAAAGALLSRRGFRVLLVDTGGDALRPDGGWLVPTGPSLLPSTRHLPAAEALLGELGLATDAARALEPLTPDLQLLMPRHRLDLARDRAHLAAELRREWPGDAARVGAGLDALSAVADAGGLFLKEAPPLPPAGFLDGFPLRKALKAAAQAAGRSADDLTGAPPLAGLDGHPLGAALLALHRFLGHLDGEQAPLSVSRLCGAALRGLHRTSATAPPLDEALRRKVAETRGQVIGSAAEPARIESIALDGNRLGAVRLHGSPDAYVARAFVLGGPARSLVPLLPPEAVRGRVAEALARITPGRRLASRHLVLGPAAIPPGLGPAALVLADGAPDDAVLVEVAAARREPRKGHAEPAAGERLVSAWTLAPADGDAAAALARLDAAIAEAVPFHERHVVHAAAATVVPHLVRVDEPALGVAGLPVRGLWKNLFLASREVVPGLGLEGELYAGLQAAVHAATLLGAKDKPR